MVVPGRHRRRHRARNVHADLFKMTDILQFRIIFCIIRKTCDCIILCIFGGSYLHPCTAGVKPVMIGHADGGKSVVARGRNGDGQDSA
jgi:hypothetical protein